MDLYLRLIVGSGRENFGLGSRNGGVAVDKWSTNAAHGLDTESERGDIEEKNILHVALEYAALDGRTDSYDFVRVNALHRVFLENVFDFFDNSWHTSHTADHDDFVDVVGTEFCVF